jgi:pyruvate dehydrogenase E2 component (dihydrolipoamide acetyltransferase)
MREQMKADFPDVKISLNDLIVKACAVALKLHPMVNSQYLGDRIRRFHTIDISVAVATEEGLITPVIHSADHKGVAQIAEEIRALAERARAKKLAPEEYRGGTFTISNLGMYGIDEFNGIINTPQACLLAVSAVVAEPVVEGDRIVPGKTMAITLSSDHRVVDGVAAAEFLRTLTRILENPLAMVM